MQLVINHFIDSAHQLPDSEDLITKKCMNLHGHTYAIRVEIKAENNSSGMIVDFKAIKNVIDQLDHVFINDVFEKEKGWSDRPTTAENIALFLKKKIRDQFGFLDMSVGVCEGYKGADNSNWVYA